MTPTITAFKQSPDRGRGLARDLSRFGPDRPLRDLRGSAHHLLEVEVQSPAILDDLDRPEDLERLRARIALSPGKALPRAPDPRAGGSIGG